MDACAPDCGASSAFAALAGATDPDAEAFFVFDEPGAGLSIRFSTGSPASPASASARGLTLAVPDVPLFLAATTGAPSRFSGCSSSRYAGCSVAMGQMLAGQAPFNQ